MKAFLATCAFKEFFKKSKAKKVENEISETA
jgi:hypothetical protein